MTEAAARLVHFTQARGKQPHPTVPINELRQEREVTHGHVLLPDREQLIEAVQHGPDGSDFGRPLHICAAEAA